jgi:hypothetical protein
LGQYFCGRKLVQQPIRDTATVKFRRSGSSSTGASSSSLLPGWATNARAMGVFADDVSTLGEVARTMGSTTDALSPGMVRKTEQSGMPNQTTRFPQRQQKLQGSGASSGIARRRFLLMDRGVVKVRQGQGVRLCPMTKQSLMWRKVQRRW